MSANAVSPGPVEGKSIGVAVGKVYNRIILRLRADNFSVYIGTVKRGNLGRRVISLFLGCM